METEIIYKLYSASDCISHALLIRRIVKRDCMGRVLYIKQYTTCADSPDKLRRIYNQWYSMTKMVNSSDVRSTHKGDMEISIKWKR